MPTAGMGRLTATMVPAVSIFLSIGAAAKHGCAPVAAPKTLTASNKRYFIGIPICAISGSCKVKPSTKSGGAQCAAIGGRLV